MELSSLLEHKTDALLLVFLQVQSNMQIPFTPAQYTPKYKAQPLSTPFLQCIEHL